MKKTEGGGTPRPQPPGQGGYTQPTPGQGGYPQPPAQTNQPQPQGKSAPGAVNQPVGVYSQPVQPASSSGGGSRTAPMRQPPSTETPPIANLVHPPVTPYDVPSLKTKVASAHASVDSQSGGVASVHGYNDTGY